MQRCFILNVSSYMYILTKTICVQVHVDLEEKFIYHLLFFCVDLIPPSAVLFYIAQSAPWNIHKQVYISDF